MKKPNITKGEWQVFPNTGKITTKKGCVIADVTLRKNVKPISAVPEMIDALIDIKYQLKSLSNNDKYDLLDTVDFSEIEQALKKAGVQL